MTVMEIAALDAILTAHAGDLGRDFTPYRNHCYRVANLCLLRASADPGPSPPARSTRQSGTAPRTTTARALASAGGATRSSSSDGGDLARQLRLQQPGL